MRIADLFLRMVADFSGFEKDVVKGAQSAGDKAGLAVGERISGGFSRGAKEISRTLGSIGQELTKTGRGMLTNITLPLLAAGGAATKFALDFDTTLRQIVGLTDVTGDEIDGIREKILALGPAVGKGPQELAEAFYFIASAGFKADEAMVVLETSAKAAAAGLGDTQTIAQVLGGVINAYGRENITAATAADILTEAVSQGTAEASGLASVIGNVVPGAAALGVSFDQVTAAMAGMTLSGVGVEESATSLIQIFNSLLKPTVQAEEAMKGLGLSGAELRRQLREEGLLATLRTLEERFAGNETASAAVFGNIRALRGVTALLTLDSDQLNGVFAKVHDSLGRLTTAYDETEGPQREVARSMASIQATAIELGADVLPMVVQVFAQLARSAKEVGTWWKSLDDDTRRQIVQWLAWLAVAGPVLILLGKLATGLSALFKLVGFLSGAKGLPLLASKIKALGVAGSLAAAGIIGVGVAVGQMNADIIDTQLGFAKRIKALGGDIDTIFRQSQDLADETGVSWNEAVETIVSGMEEAAGRVPEVWGRAQKQMRDDLHVWAVDAEKNAGDVGKAIPEGLAAGIEGGKFVVKPAMEEVVDPIQEALTAAKEEVAKKAKEIIDALISGLFEGKQDLTDAWAEILEIINHPYPDLVRRADIEGKLTATALFDGLHSKDSLAQAKTAEFMLGLISQYETLEPGALAAGELVNPALQAGIDRNLDALVTWIQQTALPGITNPFDLADELELMGYEGLAGYVRGVEQARLDKIATTVGLVRRDVKAGMLVDLYNEGYNSAKTYGTGFTAGAAAVAIPAVQKFGGKIKGLLAILSEPKDPESPLRGITKWGYNAVVAIAKSALRGIPEMVRAFSAVGYAMAVQPGTMTPAWAGAVPTAAGLYGGTSTPALTPSGNVTHIHLNVEGQKPVVSTAVEIAEQASRLGRFKI